jgi:hypothetical protein
MLAIDKTPWRRIFLQMINYSTGQDISCGIPLRWMQQDSLKRWYRHVSCTRLHFFFVLVQWDFGYCGHYYPIVPVPDDRWWWLWRNWWNENWQGKPKFSEKSCPSATLSTTNPTWLVPGLNPGRRGGKPATNRLHGHTSVRRQFSRHFMKLWLFEVSWTFYIKWCLGPILTQLLEFQSKFLFLLFKIQLVFIAS